jgi:hypothetical protein
VACSFAPVSLASGCKVWAARAVVAVSACVCVYLFALSMYTAAQASNPEAPAVIVAAGFFLGLPGAPIL